MKNLQTHKSVRILVQFTVIGNAHSNIDFLLPMNKDNVPKKITPIAAPEF